MKDAKEHIDCIIYFIKSYDIRIFLELEERKIRCIIGYEDIEILFVLYFLKFIRVNIIKKRN